MSNQDNFVRAESVTKYYKLGKVIGQGTFGTVHQSVRRADGTEWGLKIMDQNRLTKEDIEGLISEIAIVKHIHHENIVHVLECYDDGTEKFVMVMELMRGGELLDRIITRKFYSEKNAAEVIRDVARALEYCHARNIAHRDVKPENLLLVSEDSETVKLADFGFAKVRVAKDSLNTACGTPGYAAPELLTRKRHKNYTLKVDLWSLGIVLYILLCGFPPFHDENTAKLYRKITKGAYTFPPKYFKHVSQEAKDLVSKLLIVEPEERLRCGSVYNFRGRSVLPFGSAGVMFGRSVCISF
eukprot:INCI10151.3.p1 GENE.INCI10151.3~~INCI10151.3.p1  ORF type:complete len:298 (-),score=36.30 INCI10151.3:599-1492(-)